MVKWTKKSEDDLDIIGEHIAENFNVELAIETILGSNPLAGTILEVNPLFSKLVFEGNSIFYCENPKDRHLYIVYIQPRRAKLKTRRLNTSGLP